MYVIPGPALLFDVSSAPSPQDHREWTWQICRGMLRPALAHANDLDEFRINPSHVI
jgi:hypothetical protein